MIAYFENQYTELHNKGVVMLTCFSVTVVKQDMYNIVIWLRMSEQELTNVRLAGSLQDGQ